MLLTRETLFEIGLNRDLFTCLTGMGQPHNTRSPSFEKAMDLFLGPHFQSYDYYFFKLFDVND